MIRIQEEAERCLNCKKPKCVTGCPIDTAIPEAIQMFKNNRVNEAAQMLFDNNPLSLVCSIVCNHEAQCEGHCIRGIKSTPVGWSDIEHFISGSGLERVKIDKKPPTGKRVAVIGSGPAGMTASIFLAKEGHEVTVFEEQPLIGGMLQYGIPEFRLPKTILQRYAKKMKDAGIHLRMQTAIGISLTIPDLLRDGYDAILCSSGLWRAQSLGVPGESLPNVCYGINYLASPASFELGQRVAIIGTGNTAMDVARTALHSGVEHVALYARSSVSRADPKERELALLEGAEIITGVQIIRIDREGPVFKQSILDENGRCVGTEDEEILYPADTTVIAASQGPKSKLINTTEGLEGTSRGLLKVDDNGMTTVKGVFAAGDIVHGGKTVVEAAAEAKRVAFAMNDYLASM